MSESDHNALLLEVLKDVRNEMRHHRALLLETLDQGRTLERAMDAQLLGVHQRIRELKEELEQTIRGELVMLIAGLEMGGC
jgi:hypoxanthine-guanine phosphoribosyltransferase